MGPRAESPASNNDNEQGNDAAAPPPTVCVIGCGPGGMSFLHAIAHRRSRLEDAGDYDGLAALPVVECYEKSDSPGGVWRSAGSSESRRAGVVGDLHVNATTEDEDLEGGNGSSFESVECVDENDGVTGNSAMKATDEASSAPPSPRKPTARVASAPDGQQRQQHSGGEESSTNMYEALWINGNKQALEFFDYTFDEHFERPLAVYLPRSDVLDYVLQRVTTKRNIFKDVHFNTAVTSVSYDDATEKFEVCTEDAMTGQVLSTKQFDKCIWSGGLNARANVPSSVRDMLRREKFAGTVIHSTEMKDFERTVRGKRLMFVGDSYSAEDLALQSLKLGATRVYITSRGNYGTASYVAAWPGDRVEVLWYQIPCGVTKDGTGLLCGAVEWNYDTESYQLKAGSEPREIEDISTVVFCTGYESNMDCLSPELKAPWDKGNPKWVWSAPDGWVMKHNCLSGDVGEIIPSEKLTGAEYFVRRGIYRHALISNPNMMFLYEATSYPLLGIDVAAWLCLSYICGDVELPSTEEMERQNSLQSLDELSIPYLRYYKDKNYYAALQKLPEDHWWRDLTSEGYRQYEREYYGYENRILARDMMTCGYPGGFGTYDELSERGELMVEMTVADCLSRYTLSSKSPDSAWRTFRDRDPSPYKSIFTGTKAVPLKGRWMDLDNGGDVKEEESE